MYDICQKLIPIKITASRTVQQRTFVFMLSNGKSEDNDGLTRIIAFNFRVTQEIEDTDYEYVGQDGE